MGSQVVGNVGDTLARKTNWPNAFGQSFNENKNIGVQIGLNSFDECVAKRHIRRICGIWVHIFMLSIFVESNVGLFIESS